MNWKILLIIPFLLAVSHGSFAQEGEKMVKIRGLVKTANDKPVANAFIFVDGEILDTKTRTNGKFRIKVPESSR